MKNLPQHVHPWIVVLGLFCRMLLTEADSTKGVPEIYGFDVESMPPQEFIEEIVSYDFPSAILNAALAATVTTDAIGESIPCNQSILVTGSVECLKKYHTSASRVQVVLPYNETSQCPDGYEIGVACDGSAMQFSNTVTSDINAINDENYGIAWAHEIQPNETVTITFDFPEPFKIYDMMVAIETVPISLTISGSLNGEELTRLKTHQLETCPSSDDKCGQIPGVTDEFLVLSISPEFEVPITLDKLVITLPGEASWKEYNTDYWLIKEIYIISECVCESGTCSSDIVESDPRSVRAMYSCDCLPNYGGFPCDVCATDSYNTSGTCEPCLCEEGALSEQCDSNGTCQCDSSRYDSVDTFDSWNTKCQPYITDITPLEGPVGGGTEVTITGGMLSQLELTNCKKPIATDNTQLVCEMDPGTSVGTSVLLVRDSDMNGVEQSYEFTYTENFIVSDISPISAFASGGRTLTIKGTNLEYTSAVELHFTFTCLFTQLSQNFSRTQTRCTYVANVDEVHCESLSFCDVRNECRETGRGTTGGYCTGETVEGSIAATISAVDIEVEVVVDGLPVLSRKPFLVTTDPIIYPWQNALQAISTDSSAFMVPGDFLNSSASFHDYIISINGVEASATHVNESRLTVTWPSSQPVGETNVTIGYLSKVVGSLQVAEASNQVDIVVATVVPIAVLLVLVAVCVPLLVWWWKRKNRLHIKMKFIKEAHRPGNVRYIKHNGEMSFIPLGHLVSDTQLIEQLKPFLIDKERLSLSTQLGAGQFGTVYKGSIIFDDHKQMTVAAKTLKVDAGVTEEMVCGFLKEATLMSNFNHHNVLTLIGIVYGESNMPIVVLPYMHKGDIRGLVHSDDEVFVLGDLLHFCMQIARGMQYLAETRFVHRDLAARNCMVDQNYVVKIADFGLSHDIYEDDYYRTDENSSKPLPVKWMAAESLNTGKFTTESDMWSYGVVMWEVITRGVTPYPLVSNYDIKTYLNSGERLEQPEYCPNLIFDIMQTCWLTDPKDRPKFGDVADHLSDILNGFNYEERSKTKDIKSDYYLQEESRDDLQQLYLQTVE